MTCSFLPFGKGKLLQQLAPATTKGLPFNFGKSMFAKDTTYLLLSQAEIQKGCTAIFKHMQCFGLLMHVRELDKDSNHKTQSKMEAMFIPAHPMTPAEMDASTTVILFGDNNQYNIPFSTEFKYLGSHITPDLKDITNINTRLCQAKAQTTALGTFFHSSTNTWSKCLIFLALLINTALYSAKSWTLMHH
jgi:hypothetical protein